LSVQPDYAVRSTADLANELQHLDQEVGAVVIDFDMNINFIKLMKAVLHLRDANCLFVAGGTDVYVPTQSDVSILGKLQDAVIN
jgi:ribonucleotide monophosphatase NagD (HAD superfamily)